MAQLIIPPSTIVMNGHEKDNANFCLSFDYTIVVSVERTAASRVYVESRYDFVWEYTVRFHYCVYFDIEAIVCGINELPVTDTRSGSLDFITGPLPWRSCSPHLQSDPLTWRSRSPISKGGPRWPPPTPGSCRGGLQLLLY